MAIHVKTFKCVYLFSFILIYNLPSLFIFSLLIFITFIRYLFSLCYYYLRFNSLYTPNEQKLVDCKNAIAQEFKMNPDDLELSMGMSSDFEIAVRFYLYVFHVHLCFWRRIRLKWAVLTCEWAPQYLVLAFMPKHQLTKPYSKTIIKVAMAIGDFLLSTLLISGRFPQYFRLYSSRLMKAKVYRGMCFVTCNVLLNGVNN